MNFEIVLSVRAKKDIKNSFDWYEEQLSGLGGRFLFSIDNVFNIISHNPEAFPIQKSGVRQRPVKEFSFVIVYKISGNTIIRILRVFHTSRNPRFK